MDFDDDEDVGGVDESWMGTFSDLSLLLLVFFILLFSLSSIETIKFKSVFGSMRNAFGGADTIDLNSGGQSEGKEENEAEAMQEFMRIREEMLQAQEMVYNAIRSFITTKGVEGEISAVYDEGIITLTVPDGVLFEPGSADLSPAAGPVLEDLLNLFREHRDQSINIKGYTDNSPIPPDARFRDNWELSALRAVSVLHWFVDAGIPFVRLTATGMGDLNPLFPNDTPQNQARNRRVEFTLERKVGGRL
ncbi:MAG: flagellar motor protein MotB [Desulfovibrionaceae bacterium]|nr:flagellar motor protein MotB [Desulfovibrionaceae bacterium]